MKHAGLLRQWLCGLSFGTLLLSIGCAGGGCASNPASPGRPGTVDEEVWAIRCITIQTPDRFQRAAAYADAVRKVPNLDPKLVQVIHDDDGSAVFYGRYTREYAGTGDVERYRPDHLKDLEAIRSLRFQDADVWPFMLASMDVLPTFQSSHPEWELHNARGYWTLHVAVFYNTEQFRSRRSAAEQYCALLRQQKEDAFFHHGTSNSSVYVGAFPKEAVVEVRRENPLANRVETAMTITDPKMVETQRRFPITLHNGHKLFEIRRNPSGEVAERIPTESFPVVIPGADRARGEGPR